MSIEELLKLGKSCEYERSSIARCFCHSPCYVFSIEIASDGGGEADAYVYNGEDASGILTQGVMAVDEAMAQVRYFPPLYFKNGIYLLVGSNVLAVLIQYLPESTR